MKLEIVQKPTTIMTPQLLQAIELLQMGSQELMEYASDAVQENPVLEWEEYKSGAETERALVFGEFSQVSLNKKHRGDSSDEDGLNRVPDRAGGYQETLFHSLRSQLQVMEEPREIIIAAVILAESLNSSGWLDESIPEIAESSGCSEKTLEEALRILQALEPAGVGARNLAECLLLQLERYYPDETLAMRIVRDHLEAVSKNQYGLIAGKTGSSKDAVWDACEIIRSLEPRPGRAFFDDETPEYIVPDVILTQKGSRFEIKVNERFSPSLRISGYYKELTKNCDDPDVKNYLAEKMRQAKWLISTIEQRQRTLCECVGCIVRLQEAFFLYGSGNLAPMTLADIAIELDVHESTVSRALKGKYLQCQMGIFPMSHFFSRSFATSDGTNSISPDMVKALLRELIQNEDKSKPLSDQKLCDQLNESGCAISRRTVAKYRDEMNIPGVSGRKIHKGKVTP